MEVPDTGVAKITVQYSSSTSAQHAGVLKFEFVWKLLRPVPTDANRLQNQPQLLFERVKFFCS